MLLGLQQRSPVSPLGIECCSCRGLKISVPYTHQNPISKCPFVCIPNPERQLKLTPADCKAVLHNGKTSSGGYILQPVKGQFVNAYCDMTTDGGGWTVFQRRKDGSVDFYRGWLDYENGFGKLSGEFWLGNKLLHLLTSLGPTELRIDFNGGEYVKYSSFSVGDAASKYRLTVSGYSGNDRKGDKLTYHNNMKFTTNDQDNDPDVGNCARIYSGAWWYKHCYTSNLNGVYGKSNSQGIQWTDHSDNMKTLTEMKLRRL